MSTITSLAHYDSFIKECRFFFCQSVYEDDWTGKEKYILASDTPEEELLLKYPEIMKKLSPYLFCNAACGDIYAESVKNISKFQKRSLNTISYGAIEEIENEIDHSAIDLDVNLLIEEALSVCTPIQQKRIKQYYIDGMTLKQIASGKDITSVRESIQAGVKKIKKHFGVNPKK